MVYSYTTDEKNENPRFPNVSSGAERVYGISPEAIMDDAMMLISIIHPDDIGSFVASVNESWETLEAWDWKGRFKMPTEEFKWIRCSSMPQRRPNGHTIWHGAVFDIQADVELEESRAELDSLVRSANAPIFQVDPRGVRQPEHDPEDRDQEPGLGPTPLGLVQTEAVPGGDHDRLGALEKRLGGGGALRRVGSAGWVRRTSPQPRGYVRDYSISFKYSLARLACSVPG